MMRPLVSVVMGVRDSSRFVDSAVRSALGQTYAPLEMVVIDDGSVDGTADVLVAIRDDRLRVLHTEGRGSAAARNAGIRETTGAYVAFLDADDLWDSVKITEHIKVMEPASHVSLTFSQSRLIDENGTPLPLRVRRARGRCDFESLLRDNVIANGSAVVVRRNAIPVGGFNETLAGCVDYELWLRMALIHPGSFVCIPQVLTSYRRHAGQVSGDWRRMQSAWELLILRMRELAPEITARAEPAARTNWYRYLSFIAYEGGEEGEAVRLLMQSFMAGPAIAALNPRTWMLAGAIAAGAVLPASMRPRSYGLRSVSRKVS